MKKGEGALQRMACLSNMQAIENWLMTLGELFLEAVSTGVITNGEMTWVTDHQNQFTRTEEAAHNGSDMVDEGLIQLGCRWPAADLQLTRENQNHPVHPIPTPESSGWTSEEQNIGRSRVPSIVQKRNWRMAH